MTDIHLVSREEWLNARKALLAEEKALTQRSDEIARKRRELPLVRIEKDYQFDSDHGTRSLADLFEGRRQLLVMHFMFGPDWEEGCPSCSFWADSYDGIECHLNARDTAFVCVSTASLEKIRAYRKRMGWRFAWVSGSPEFGADFGVSSYDGHRPGNYNYRASGFEGELPGLSAFYRLADGGVAHSYSTYARGLDRLNPAYQFLDSTHLGRQEESEAHTMAWVRRHDCYD